MPSPYIGNDDAARYVAYYASPLMQRDTVRRLHDVGVRRREESHRRAEEAAYPSQPRTYRSQKEIDDYVNNMVYREMFRRQKKLADLECEMYKSKPTRYLSRQNLETHVQRMYDQQMRRKENRERERLERFGTRATSAQAGVRGQKGCRDLEERWRPPSAHIKYEDGKMLLVSELAAVHGERSSSCPPSSSADATPKDAANRRRHADLERLRALAKPLRVTPKVRKEQNENSLTPPFRLFGDVMRTRGKTF